MSQTKEETINWINDNINDYPVTYEDNPIDVVERITIEDEYLYFYHHWKRTDDNYYSGSWNRIKLKDILSIEYSKDSAMEGGKKWINLYLNVKNDSFYDAKVENEFQNKKSIQYSLNTDRTAIVKRSNMNYLESGMDKRIEKALLHIIKLNGGKAFVKKEPF